MLDRARRRAAGAELGSRRDGLRRVEVALRAHEPERTLERGYVLAETESGEPVTTAEVAATLDEISLRFADGRLKAKPT